MLLTLIKIQGNMIDYLTLTTSGFLKILLSYYYQRLDSKINLEEQKEEVELGCWQEPPEDIKEMIVKHMSFSGRARLSSLCKSWRSASVRRDILTCSQLPWLVHPQPKTGDSLSFSSLSEGKVFKSTLPCPNFKSMLYKLLHGKSIIPTTSYFLESSRCWLVMKEWEFYCTLMIKQKKLVIYLVNPVSGALHGLPPLQTIPGYKEHSEDSYIRQVVLSSQDVGTCMVAATLGTQKLLICRPRDESWSVFHVFDANDSLGSVYHILFSSTTRMLYALVRDSSHCRADTRWIESRSLKFGDEEVSLKVIYDKEEWWVDEGLAIQEGNICSGYLSESTNNEPLLIYQIHGNDVGDEDEEGNVVEEEGNVHNDGEGDDENVHMEGNEQNESVLGWVRRFIRKALHLKSSYNENERDDILDLRTRCFRVYKFDQDNNKFCRVQDLGDQMLFLAEDNSSMSLLARDFKDLRGNCIYFATRGRDYGTIHTSREIGIFYLDTGRIERSFPSLEMDKESRLGWLMPSLW